MSLGYSDVPTRDRAVGALDKAVLMSEIAESLTQDKQFNEFVSRTVAGAGNAADAQASRWAQFVENLQYVRESGEVYRDWKETVGLTTGVAAGGDCDDLTILLVAGVRSIGMQAHVEILTDEEGWGFHVRARVGLPPHRPTFWAVVDPVWQSERQWAMEGRDPAQSPLAQQGRMQAASIKGGQSSFDGAMLSTANSSTKLLLSFLAGMGLILWWKRQSTRQL